MGATIAGLLILATFFTSALIMFRVTLFGDILINNSTEQVRALEEERLLTRVSIKSTSIFIIFGCETQIKSTLENVGDVAIDDLDHTDIIAWYVAESGDYVITNMVHTGGNLAKNEWTFSSISGDTINPGLWDPGETANLTSRLEQQPKAGELGYVTVVTPNGVSDSAYVDFTSAVAGECFYLHNNPSPPTGPTNRQANLPWGDKLPSADTLYNYDADHNSDPALTLLKTNLGLGETSSQKFQAWRSEVLTTGLVISGDMLVDLWAAVKNYTTGDTGIITLYLRDYDPATNTYAAGKDPIAKGTLFSADWQSGVTGDFVERAVLVPGISYTVPKDHRLEAFMVVENASSQEMWVAYDTVKYASLVNIDYDAPTPKVSYYLHNNPTPPTADTCAQATLPLTTAAPTATTLFNYDKSGGGCPPGDNDPGLSLLKTAQRLNETDSEKLQVWRTGVLASDLVVSGDVLTDVWAAIKGYDVGQQVTDKAGAVTMYLRDYCATCNPTHKEIGNASVFSPNWHEGTQDFIKKTIIIPNVGYTVPAGRELEVRLMVDNESGDQMWFAYDTVSHRSVIKLP